MTLPSLFDNGIWIYFSNLLLNPQRPINPEPRSSRVPGSGTDDGGSPVAVPVISDLYNKAFAVGSG